MQTVKRVKDPRKQRKKLYNAPAHIRHKLMAAPLSPELAKSRGIKSLPVRKGDTVRVVRGDRKGFEGKISRIDLKNYRLYVEGLTREKVDGTTIFISLHPSKVTIKNLNLDDRWRKSTIERKKQQAVTEKEVEKEKPATTDKVKTERPAEAKVETVEKKPEKTVKTPEIPKISTKKAAAEKTKEDAAVKKGKKIVKKKTTKASSSKKKPTEGKSAKEGGT
jgi:large subunit ribosomal protein L24